MNLSNFSDNFTNQTQLLPSIFQIRSELNRKYLICLRNEQLLQNFYLEAGFWQPAQKPSDAHWGWESPTCQVRGHFLGHWLSAASRLSASIGDTELKGKADQVIIELARCQKENGGEWVFSIPEKYLDWAVQGKSVWAPHYTIHKTLMGLFDAYFFLKNETALTILINAAKWFHRWTGKFSQHQLNDLLDYETGGMLEAWANLYSITGESLHLDLINRYDRPRLFDRLLKGEDPLTNRHANTTIPEAHGAARAYEVTGETRWKEIALAYWNCAVENRGTFVTGSQTAGEIWTPPFSFSARLTDKNQEHCVVYNMIRLAEYLYQWTGDPVYADYIERNLYNGILTQQNPQTGMVTYFLGLRPGSRKNWGSFTKDFWCCHGTLVQAHTLYNDLIFYKSHKNLVINQYIPSGVNGYWDEIGSNIQVKMVFDQQSSTSQAHLSDGIFHYPDRWIIKINLECTSPSEFILHLRLPEWIVGNPKVTIDGEIIKINKQEQRPSYLLIEKTWFKNIIIMELPMKLRSVPLPDRPDTAAFLFGPIVLAGLCAEERQLRGDILHPESILIPDSEREWENWKLAFRTQKQESGIRFIPIYEVTNEAYTVYFPIRK